MARIWVLFTEPTRASTFSCSTAFCRAARAPGLVDWLSTMIRLIFFPFTPPAALICLRASLMALIWSAPSAAEAPVTGGVKPSLISGSAATAAPLPIAATATSATSATDKNRFLLAMPSSFFSLLPAGTYWDQRRYPALERHRSPAAARNSTRYHCKNRGNSQAGSSLSATSS